MRTLSRSQLWLCLRSTGESRQKTDEFRKGSSTKSTRMRFLVAIGTVAMLAGCASPAVFQDPKTGNVAQCNATTPSVFPIIAQNEINNCAAAYERMGWKRQ